MSLKKALFASAGLMLFSVGAFAAPPLPTDVPVKHWASASVASVTHKKIMTTDGTGKFNGNQFVTRYELAVALDRFVKYFDNSKKPLTPMPRPHAEVSTSEGKAAVASLRAGGYIAKKSPLITGDGNKPVTAKELSEALAQVSIQISSKTVPTTTP